MTPTFIDAMTGLVITEEEAQAKTSIYAFVSWRRLTEIMRAAGELRSGEAMFYKVTQTGIEMGIKFGGGRG